MRATFTRRSLGGLLLGILAGRNSWDELFRPKPLLKTGDQLTLWYSKKALATLQKKFAFYDKFNAAPRVLPLEVVQWYRYKDNTNA